jgi:hypothetical protein
MNNVDCINLPQNSKEIGSCEREYESSDPIQCKECIIQLRDYYLLKSGCIAWSLLNNGLKYF